MNKLPSYRITLPPTSLPTFVPIPKPPLHEYAYSEFSIALASHWAQVPTSTDNTVRFQSKEWGAELVISADFYDIPEAKAMTTAERSLAFRLDALEALAPGRVQVFQRSVRPHSLGLGLELLLAAEVAGEFVQIHLGYVTSRKILNFTLTCGPDRRIASGWFDQLLPHFRVQFP